MREQGSGKESKESEGVEGRESVGYEECEGLGCRGGISKRSQGGENIRR